MNTTIEMLIDSLRQELQEYGEMLALLDRQQEYLRSRAVSEVFQSISVIKAQGGVLQEAQRRRDECRRALAQDMGQSAEAAFAELLPLLPADYQPLVQALVEENNELIARVRRRARLNHLLLSRSVELMQEVVNTLLPRAKTTVYDGSGFRQSPLGGSRPLYEAVG